MNTTTHSLRTPTYISILSIVIMLVLYVLTALGYMGDNPVGQGGNYEAPLIVPSGYAFAIWSVIYIGIIAFPFYQLIKRKEGHASWRQLHRLFSINVICNGLWLVAASYDWQWTTVLIIVVMLITLYMINQILRERRSAGDYINYWMEQFPLSIYFAWITLATALNVSSALNFYSWDGLGISEEIWTLSIMSVAAIIAYLVFRKFGEPSYAAVVVWAFIALYIRHQGGIATIAGLSVAIASIFALLTIGGTRRKLST